MVQARERYKSGIRHVLNTLLHPRSDAIRLAAIQEARHPHRGQHVVQSRSVQLIRREGNKIVIEKLRLLRRGQRREFESQPPGESLDEGPGIGAIEAALRGRDPLVRMRTADDESLDSFWRIFCHAPPDPPAHRVPPEVCRRDLEGVEHRHDISDLQGQSIRIGVVRFVTRAMPAGIQKDELVVGFEWLDVSRRRPAPQVPGIPVLKHQGRARALDAVVDTKALIGRVWHRRYLLIPGIPPSFTAMSLNSTAGAHDHTASCITTYFSLGRPTTRNPSPSNRETVPAWVQFESCGVSVGYASTSPPPCERIAAIAPRSATPATPRRRRATTITKQVTRHWTPSPSGGRRRSRRSAPGRGSSCAGPYWHQPIGSPRSYTRMPCARPVSTSARFSAMFWTREDARFGNILRSRWQPRWYSMQAQNAHPRPGANNRSKSAHVSGPSSFVV